MNRLSESLLWLSHLCRIATRSPVRRRVEPPAAADLAELTRQFESLYEKIEDPWHYRTNWYERARQDLAATLITGQPRQILDLGCGEGELTGRIQQRFPSARLTGVDASHTAVRRAKARLPKVRLKKFILGLDSTKSLDQFDTILACDILSYGDEESRPRMLRDLDRLLEPRGQLIVSLCPRYHQKLIDRLYKTYRLEAEHRIRDLTWVGRLRKSPGKPPRFKRLNLGG